MISNTYLEHKWGDTNKYSHLLHIFSNKGIHKKRIKNVFFFSDLSFFIVVLLQLSQFSSVALLCPALSRTELDEEDKDRI